MKWTSTEIKDQIGKVAIVTGANSGIGFETAAVLARKGAHVILACRSLERGEQAARRIRELQLAGSVSVERLDLSSLESVAAFAGTFLDEHERLDLFVANAGVMMPPERSETADGFELQLGTNHLGHFALVGRLVDVLRKTNGARVVVVSSTAHKFGSIAFDDLNWKQRPYKRMKSYGQSKLANLLFVRELRRRLEAAGADTLVAAAHPGWTATNLQRDTGLFRLLNPLFAMPPWQGALPSLYAATADDVRGGDYYGPDGLGEMRGYPKRVGVTSAAQDPEAAKKLWQLSEELTGVRYLS